MEQILTIGIPTWNRADLIGKTLDETFRLIDALPPEDRASVEVLVSDNASTDDTPAICRRFRQDRGDALLINRNPVNIGFSRNVDMLFKCANGRHVLILSDDDGLEPDALPILISEIRKHPTADCAFVRSTAYTPDLAQSHNTSTLESLRRSYPPSSPSLFFTDIRSYYKHRRTLTNVCISGCVFRRDAWNSVSLEHGLNSGSVQLYAVLRLQILGGGIICIERPGIKYRDANAAGNYIETRAGGWQSGIPFVYPFDAIAAIKACKEFYPDDIYKSFYLVCVRDLAQTMIDAKARRVPANWEYFNKRLASDMDEDFLPILKPTLSFLSKLGYHPTQVIDRTYKLLRRFYYFLFRLR